MGRGKKKGFFTLPMVITSIILVLILIMSVFSEELAPFDPEEANLAESLCRPFEKGHILGTDKLGRDLLSRIIVGSRSSIFNALLIVAFEMTVGIPIGLLCGYYRGIVDSIVMKIWDIICSLPSLLLAFVLVAAFGKGSYSGVIAMGIVYTPLTAKLARSLIITEKSQVYVEAAKSLGYSDMRIIFHHILPNCITTMTAQLTLDIGTAIVSMASLSYLGLGVQPPKSDWGSLLNDGMSMLYTQPIMLAAPAAAIMITAISINIFSDGIQAYMDPGQRKLASFKKQDKRKKTA